jgi:hypothetical protein
LTFIVVAVSIMMALHGRMNDELERIWKEVAMD